MKFLFPLSIVVFISSVVVAGIVVVSSLHREPTDTTIIQANPSVVGEDTMERRASWFSGLYAFPSFPVFGYPGAYRISEQGFEISLPTITTNEKLIAGAFVSQCVVHPTNPLSGSRVLGYGDFHVRVELTDGIDTWQATIVQGSPVVYIEGQKPLEFSCTIPNNRIVFQTSSEQHNSLLTYRVILLPTEMPASDPFIQDLPWAEPTGTRSDYTIDPATQKITTTFSVTTASGEKTLLTLWPHHQSREQGIGSYETVLGKLHLVETNTFATHTAIPILPLTFSKVTDAKEQSQLKIAIQTDADRLLKETPPTGVYFRGTWIGGLTSLIQLADLYGEVTLRDQLLSKLESVVTPTLSDFHYDPEKFLWVANHPEFGNEKGNDHHFHYGYYIRASAILVHFRPQLLASLKPAINEMIADIASQDHNDRYPRLRVFSPYEGHGWASGDAAFADGNNQESTSEALNAWYAIKIWGDVTADVALSERGTWLFSQELMGTNSYWFGINNTFPAGYNRSLASLVWGGKREFATWFSADPMHVYGIQWLPITPASTYLSSEASRGWFEELGRLDAKPATHEWGDLYTAVLGLTDAKKARELLPQIQTTKGMYVHSLLLQMVHANVR